MGTGGSQCSQLREELLATLRSCIGLHAFTAPALIASNNEASTSVRNVKQLGVAVLERRSGSARAFIAFPHRGVGEIASGAAKRRAKGRSAPTPFRCRYDAFEFRKWFWNVVNTSVSSEFLRGSSAFVRQLFAKLSKALCPSCGAYQNRSSLADFLLPISNSFPHFKVHCSDGASYWASGALPHHSLAFDFNIIHRYCTFSFTTFSKS